MTTDCIISVYAPSKKGYRQIAYRGKQVPHHRLVYCLSNKIDIDSIAGLVVRHKCDNPGCINPEHLELGTHQDNSDDKWSRGRGKVGGAKGEQKSKLTVQDVLDIRASRDEYKVLAAKYGISVQTCCDIRARRSWKHI
jgi:hypothetical protein